MQFNIYVPKDKEDIIKKLNDLSSLTGRPKNELVMEALEKFVKPEKPSPGRFKLGTKPFNRQELYEEREKS